ncbi:hypothetical protein Syun_009811 [Stephania yunnanensis]|uniref:phosphoribosylglycinamide formyltransferase 1 n=1 Tax=Stephania yunnanensis TaxID=152371 RepID=A0AAP0KHP7_9MAGN
MDSRTLISGCSSNSRISLNGRSEKSIDLSLVRSQKLVFLKTQNFSKLDLKWVGARRGVECRSSVERVEGVVGVEGFESESSVRLRRKKLGVFVSSGGSNFRSIHGGTVGGSVHGDVAVVVTNKPGMGIPVIVFPKASNSSDDMSAADLVDALRYIPCNKLPLPACMAYGVDFVLLAGYLKLIPVELVHKAVIASGARFSGPTVHFVDEHYDTGHILAQGVVPVLASDTAEELAARVLHEERNEAETNNKWHDRQTTKVNDRDQVTRKQKIGAEVVLTLYTRARSHLKHVSVRHWYGETKSASTTPNPFSIIGSLEPQPEKTFQREPQSQLDA